MARIRNRIIGLVVAAALATPITVGVAEPAPASAGTCRGTSCNGHDAGAAGCGGDARTLESFWRNNVFIELRYSPSCNAAWARGVSHNVGNCSGWVDKEMLYIEGTLNGHTVRYSDVPCMNAHTGAPFRTPMVSFTYWARACLVVWPAFGDNPYYNGCTRWR